MALQKIAVHYKSKGIQNVIKKILIFMTKYQFSHGKYRLCSAWVGISGTSGYRQELMPAVQCTTCCNTGKLSGSSENHVRLSTSNLSYSTDCRRGDSYPRKFQFVPRNIGNQKCEKNAILVILGKISRIFCRALCCIKTYIFKF